MRGRIRLGDRRGDVGGEHRDFPHAGHVQLVVVVARSVIVLMQPREEMQHGHASFHDARAKAKSLGVNIIWDPELGNDLENLYPQVTLGDIEVILARPEYAGIEFYHYDRTELYNLAHDPGERNDFSEQRPEKASELKAKLAAWQVRMKARMPEPIAP